METDQKTPGQVLYDQLAFVCTAAPWTSLLPEEREFYEGVAAAVIAHDRANQPAASGVWIPVGERLPEKRERDYQVLTLASKRHVGGNYHGERITGIAQDWVVRAHVENFDSWCEIPPLPAAPEAPKP